MDLLDGLKSFVATAQTGSFTAAADQLGISNRLTSKYVADLEARLGARLFQRTTRKVGLTPAGEDLLARAPELLDELEDVLSSVSEGARSLSGVIRIAAPIMFGEIYVAGMLGRFAEANPEVIIDLRLDDRFVDLAAEGMDLAFRIGTLDAMSVKSRKLGEMRSFLDASPDYIAQHSAPDRVDDLSRHAAIVDTNRRNPRRCVLVGPGQHEVITVAGQFLLNSARSACDLAVQGKGIAFLPQFAIKDDLEAGRLVRVLDGLASETLPISAVYLAGRRPPRKVRALIDFAVSDIRSAKVI